MFVEISSAFADTSKSLWVREKPKGVLTIFAIILYGPHYLFTEQKGKKTYFPFLSMQMPPLFILLSFKFTMCPFFSAVLEIFQSYFTVLFG